MRRFGEPYKQGQSYQRRHGAYGVILMGQDALLTLQDGLSLELQLPGGGVDPGESVPQALHREVYEETGFHIQITKRLGAYQRFSFMPEYDMWAHKICHIYLCTPTRRMSEPLEPEHAALWMPVHTAAHKLTNSGDRHFMSLCLGRN